MTGNAAEDRKKLPVESSGEETERYARVPHLWALGVGAVISGDFFGWQAGLVAGFGGLTVCLVVVTVLYMLLAFTVAELSCAVPSAGGPYSFAAKSMGPVAAFFAGLAESLKVIVTCSVIVVGIGSYLSEISRTDPDYGPLWWLLFYTIFVGLNIYGVAASFIFTVAITVLSIIELLVFYVGAAATSVDYECYILGGGKNNTCLTERTIPLVSLPVEGGELTTAAPCIPSCPERWLFPEGGIGVMKGFSFSLWFYLGIEELPLAAEETINPEKNMKWGIIIAMFTLVILSFLTLAFNSVISPGAKAIHESSSPLLVGYQTVFGDNSVTRGFSFLLTIGLIASFHSFIFCMARLLFAIARDGFFPSPLAKLHSTRRTPWVALIVGSILGFIIALILYFATGIDILFAVLINLALIGALVSYLFQLVSFLVLRVKQPDLERPYRSVFGIPGASACILLCLFLLGTIIYSGLDGVIANDDFSYLFSVLAAIIYFVVGGLYYFFYVRKYFGTQDIEMNDTT